MKKKIFMAVFLAALSSVAMTADAATAISLGQAGNNITSSATGMGMATERIAFWLGLLFAMGGLIGAKNAKNNNQPIGPYMWGFAFGAALMSIMSLVGSASMTFFGSNETTSSMSALGLQ